MSTVDFEIGKYYSLKSDKCMAYYAGNAIGWGRSNNGKKWSTTIHMNFRSHWDEIPKSEFYEMVKEFAVKKGFIEGAMFNPVRSDNYTTPPAQRPVRSIYTIPHPNTLRNDGYGNIMVDGHWAEIIKTKSERKTNNYAIY
jgi:hypothetical protein